MRLLGFDLPEKMDFFHSALGGGICFLFIFFLANIATAALERLLIFFGVVGVTVFEEPFTIAKSILLFGIVYLPGGFCGGLYTGYQVEENLKTILAIPGIIGFSALTFSMHFLGYLNLSNMYSVIEVFLSLLGNLIGAYLGGYTMNWPSGEEESSEEIEKLRTDLGK